MHMADGATVHKGIQVKNPTTGHFIRSLDEYAKCFGGILNEEVSHGEKRQFVTFPHAGSMRKVLEDG